MSVALSIAFTGLCALVTGGDRTPGQVLLVDAKGIGEVGGVVLPDHAPTLVASLGSLANAETSHPTRVVVTQDQVGLWDLRGAEVRIRVQGGEGSGIELFRPSDGATSWPQPPTAANDPAAWRDLRYVPDMQQLTGDGRIDPSLVVADVDAPSLPPGVATRVELDTGRFEAGIPSYQGYRGVRFEFRGTNRAPKVRQAVTDTLRWILDKPAATVVIEIAAVGGGEVRRLVLRPGAPAHEIFISNLPTSNDPVGIHHGASAEDMAALHFGAYYRLLASGQTDPPLPRLWHGAVERNGGGLIRPLLCPPAVFVRE